MAILFEIRIKTGGTEYAFTIGPAEDIWVNSSHEWVDNPQTGAAWTWNDIDALQIGTKFSSGSSGTRTCTQVYVEVDYTPAAAAGLENKSANMGAKMIAGKLI